jgi:hypothetical protein
VARLLTGLVALAAILWALGTWLSGGFTLSLPGHRISATDPLRPLIIGVIAGLVHGFVAGRSGLRGELDRLRLFLGPARVAAMLAVVLAAVGWRYSAGVVGGADAYAYVSQADLWLAGRLKTPVPIAAEVPWPDGLATFAPLAYTPAAGTTIVPVTAAGLPLLMAGFKAVLGHCAVFAVVPLSAALLVWATFVAGRRIDSGRAGAIAAWLVATSPAVLAMSISPMSDVPAAAFWTLALAAVLGSSRTAAATGGLSASIAILIRPNLVPVAAGIAIWMLWRAKKTSRDYVAVALFCAGVVPGCLAVAWINAALYGAPWSSGYGSLAGMASLSRAPLNLTRYGWWLVESQTPLFLAGAIALVLPWRRLWPAAAVRRDALLLALVIAIVWAIYLLYLPFDEWWYLRFLLPCWPAMAIGAAVSLTRLFDAPAKWVPIAAALIVTGAGLYGLSFASRRGAFPSGEGDARYARIAKLVEDMTEPSSVILAMQHAGPTRYYAGRLTMRWDLLDPAWLDRAVDWLNARGRRAYILVEDWERGGFERRFAQHTRFRLAELAPIFVYQAWRSTDAVSLFDPRRPDGPTVRTVAPSEPGERCVLPIRADLMFK